MLHKPQRKADPIRHRVRHAIAGFLAGHSGTTLEAYQLDLRGWISRLDAAFLDTFAVERGALSSDSHQRAYNSMWLDDRAAPVDDLRVLPILLPGTDDRTRSSRFRRAAARALDLYIGERESGPIFMSHDALIVSTDMRRPES